MKIPNTFIPNRSLDKNVEMLKAEKVLKHREIEDIYSLLNLPEDFEGYRTNYKKIEDKKIPAFGWHAHFGSIFNPYLIEAGKMMYFKRASASNDSIVIYALNFNSDSELNELIRKELTRKIYVAESFTNPRYEGWLIECLKKDNYMVAILTNPGITDDLSFFKKWYSDNFGMVKI